jgi:hypothetical protein
MNQLNIVRQTQVERKMLQSLIEGLRHTMAWQIAGDDLSRKLSTMKFITRSFQSHFERLMELEEKDGYMAIVLEKHPHLTKSVEALRGDHDVFRREMACLVQGLGSVVATDRDKLSAIFDQATVLLKKVDDHNKKEADIFQEAFEREEGGEG